jgi:Putative dehydrogenase domain of multifunctional non-ribosomal peptide synthetases and related enzymes
MLRVLLTGATGFLGGELLIELSKIDRVEKVVCLIRAANDDAADERLQKVFSLHGDRYDRSRIQPLAADLIDPGLTSFLCQKRRVDDVNLIIHSAANTSFLAQKSATIEETNVLGTRRLLDWAATLRRLPTFAYIGTAAAVGSGEDVIGRTISERDEIQNLNHLVTYTRSKMMAELEVRSRIPHDKLVVIRPSILLGDSRCIVPRSFDIAWVVIAIQQMRMCFGNPDAACDIVSVDYAARAIVRLLLSSRRYATYHVSAAQLATTPRQVADVMTPGMLPVVFPSREDLAALKKWLKSGAPAALSLGAYSGHLEYITECLGKKKARILLAGLEPYWKFIDLNLRFDNSRLLSDTGIDSPEPAHEYLKRTMGFLETLDPLVAAANP